MVKNLIYIGIVLSAFLLLFSADLMALEKKHNPLLMEARYSMAGIRLGVWSDKGDNPVNDTVDFDLSSTGFVTELFIDYRLTPVIIGEISFGIISRGDVTIEQGGGKFVGPIILYPVMFQLKISPLSGRHEKFHPYLIGGGGFLFGKHNIDISLGNVTYGEFLDAQKTVTDFNYVLGGGIDLALSDQIGINFNVKYYPIQFGDELAGIKDYSGMSFSIGAAYFLHKK